MVRNFCCAPCLCSCKLDVLRACFDWSSELHSRYCQANAISQIPPAFRTGMEECHEISHDCRVSSGVGAFFFSYILPFFLPWTVSRTVGFGSGLKAPLANRPATHLGHIKEDCCWMDWYLCAADEPTEEGEAKAEGISSVCVCLSVTIVMHCWKELQLCWVMVHGSVSMFSS